MQYWPSIPCPGFIFKNKNVQINKMSANNIHKQQTADMQP